MSDTVSTKTLGCDRNEDHTPYTTSWFGCMPIGHHWAPCCFQTQPTGQMFRPLKIKISTVTKYNGSALGSWTNVCPTGYKADGTIGGCVVTYNYSFLWEKVRMYSFNKCKKMIICPLYVIVFFSSYFTQKRLLYEDGDNNVKTWK